MIGELKKNAERLAWQRKLKETRSIVAEFERNAGKIIDKEELQTNQKKIGQIKNLLSDLVEDI